MEKKLLTLQGRRLRKQVLFFRVLVPLTPKSTQILHLDEQLPVNLPSVQVMIQEN